MALFILANLFNTWLNGRQLDYHSSSGILSVVTGFWADNKGKVHPHTREREKQPQRANQALLLPGAGLGHSAVLSGLLLTINNVTECLQQIGLLYDHNRPRLKQDHELVQAEEVTTQALFWLL